MLVSELILKLYEIHKHHGDLPVILCTDGGSGSCDSVEVGRNGTDGPPEVWLQEKL